MTTIVYPCGCSLDLDCNEISATLGCPLHGLTPPEDEPEEIEE